MKNIASPAADGSVLALLQAVQALQERLEEAFGAIGLSASRFGVLDRLERAGEPLSLGELAVLQSCARSNMTQLADRLEADGLVRRIDDPTDRRTVRAQLTPTGRERHAQGAELLGRVQTWFESVVAVEDRAVLERVIAVLR